MANLPKYTLSKDKAQNDWVLKNDGTKKVADRFDTKAEATAGGSLSDALGPAGGSVKIKTTDGRIQEERTFPRSKDPKKSPG